MIYLNMPVGELYGWAVCGKYLLRSMSKKVQVGYIESHFGGQVRQLEDDVLVENAKVGDCVNFGTIYHTISPSFKPSCMSWGNKNIGYMFHEKDSISREQKANLKKYDIIVAGSEWNAEVIRKAGFKCESIPQGVDQSIFKYKAIKDKDSFVIFSGGKWESRKGQDIVIEAFKKFSQGKKNVFLMASWANLFNDHHMNEIYNATKGIPGILNIGLQTHHNLVGFMHETDMGIFPNRVEGGTNLVLMEYLSSGRTAVVDVDTGQRDVAHDDYAYCITGLSPVGHCIDILEYAYRHRDELKDKGRKAHEAMKAFSWDVMANRFLAL